jgi:hypothetical protein
LSGAELEEALTIAGLGEALQQGEGTCYVQRFPVRELALKLGDQDWESWLVDELGKIRTELSRGDAKEPLGIRAVSLPDQIATEKSFEHWRQPFVAGKLFDPAQVWQDTFAYGHNDAAHWWWRWQSFSYNSPMIPCQGPIPDAANVAVHPSWSAVQTV